MGGVVAACFCGARVPFIEGERGGGEGWVAEGSSTPLMADSAHGRAGRDALRRVSGSVVDEGGGNLVLVAVLGPCGRLGRTVGASLPGNGKGERRPEEKDDEAGNGNSCSTASRRTAPPPPRYWRRGAVVEMPGVAVVGVAGEEKAAAMCYGKNKRTAEGRRRGQKSHFSRLLSPRI